MIKNAALNNSINELLSDSKEYKELFVLYGDLNQIIINASISIIESKLITLGYSKSFASRSKFISVEVLENMFKHQSKTKSINPYFELAISDDELIITAGNSISKNRSKSLRSNLDNYKKLSHDEIKASYFEKLKDAELDKYGNAGLGLLSIFKKAHKNYEYKIEKISDNESFFNSTIRISKLTQD